MCNRRKKRKKERNNKETFEGICLLLFVPFDSISRVAMKSRRTNKGVLSVGLAVVAAADGGVCSVCTLLDPLGKQPFIIKWL